MNKILCLNCGEPGHMVNDCPKPIDRKAIAENKKLIFKNSDNRRTRNATVGGGGVIDKSKVNPRRVPPGPNNPKERTIDGKKYKWC